MNDNKIKVSGYALPIKELALGGGVSKVLTSAPAPALGVQTVTPERSAADRFTVCLFGTGVPAGDGFALPAVSYKQLYSWFDDAPKASYSAKTTWFGYRSEQGRFLSLEEVINKLYGKQVFSMAETAANRPEAVITVASGSKVSKLSASQIMDGKRFYYPLLTSEQILSGMNPAESRGARTDAGLLRTGNSEEDYKIVFVIGQRNWNDITESSFVEFADGGASITLEYLPAQRTKHNVLFVGPLGGKLGEDIIAYPGQGSDTVEITVPAGSMIRFNLDNDDFLNQAKMYYKFTLDDEPCGTPSPEDGFVYNTRIPLYFGNGADYPSGVILPPADMHGAMNIKMLAHSVSFADSEIDSFKINII